MSPARRQAYETNPSLQCRICGLWMRLHGRTRDGRYYQRFFPCYETTDGAIVEHEGGSHVCVSCESKLPGWKPYDNPMLSGGKQ